MAKAGTRIGTVRLNRVLPTPFCRPDGPTYNFRKYLAVEKTLFRNVDCVSFYIDDIEDGILFYSKQRLAAALANGKRMRPRNA